MNTFVIVFGNCFEGIEDAIGPFDFLTEAEDWLIEHPSTDCINTSKIIEVTPPR